MEAKAVRMRAFATGFDEIKVHLSKQYYNGISHKFYLKNLKTDEMELLSGEVHSSDEEAGFRVYTLNASFELGCVYRVIDAYGLSCYLDFSKLALTEEFDELYYYDGDDLGCTYTPEQSTFKVWSPLSTGVILSTVQHGEDVLYSMKRGKKGVYEITLKGNYEGMHYHYLINTAETYITSNDPYAYSSSSNRRTSIVVDLEKLKVKKFNLPRLKSKTDMIIYETSVRDFSMH